MLALNAETGDGFLGGGLVLQYKGKTICPMEIQQRDVGPIK